MLVHTTVAGTSCVADLAQPIEISIPLDFYGLQPNTYGVPHARAEAFRDRAFVGDTREGGSCNFETYHLTPHCNGTHTECLGHLTHERLSITATLRTALVPATLVSIATVAGAACTEACQPAADAHDQLITAAALEQALAMVPDAWLQALVIRSLPNGSEKRRMDYGRQAVPPAYFTEAAMHYVVRRGVQHLLLDTPSIDRLHDAGKLWGHHIFWGMPQGSHHADEATRPAATVTEFLYIPDTVPDARYLITIQVPAFVADAAPSRVFLYAIRES